ncbi:hypothetical protein GPECTOR_7g1084 [Gonium pectorale]|uniref:MYND-type domain-containing protein n=1 Tax=Gonium pectorale TaxID=33097 RepID=A0A150GTP4_GONPE|nr:hypothetical protein GPECTOR_7g1084 [Gonium pectorale]|eukprot:KXZ53191.1 hypothetical protein GPECTOR_7g1084 [Gonium pectorale]
MDFVAAFEFAAGVLGYPTSVSRLLPTLPDGPETASLFAQLADESMLQLLADWSRLCEDAGWGLAEPFRESPSAAAANCRAQARPNAFRARTTSPGSLGASVASKAAEGGRHTNAAVLVSNSCVLMMNLVQYASTSSHPSAAAGLLRLASSLRRSQLIPAVSSALRSAPALPFGDGRLATAADCHARGLDTLSCTAGVLAGHVQGAAAAADLVPCVLELISDGELQRLLLEAMERVAELYEEETGLASSETGGPHGAAVPLLTQPSTRVGGGTNVEGPGGGWPLFDASVASRRSPECDLPAATARWEVVRKALATWCALQDHGKAAAVLPPAQRQAPLALRLNRALAMAPPPPPVSYTRGLQRLAPAQRVTDAISVRLNLTMALCQILMGALARGGAEVAAALLPGLCEAWAWGIAAATRSFVHALQGAGSSNNSSGTKVKSAVVQYQKVLMTGQEFMKQSLLDPVAGWPALSPALREDVVRRLAGAGMLRTWDTVLRLAADSGDAELLGRAVGLLVPCVEVLLLPLLREAMRPRSPSAAVAATVAGAGTGPYAAGHPPSAMALPPPVPVPDPWDGARELGWLVTAAKLVSRHGWEQSSGRGGGGDGGTTLTGEVFLALRELLRSSCLSPSGLPELLPELSEAGGSSASGPDPRSVAIMEASALAARALFATADVPFSGCRDHTAASESVQNIQLVLALRAANSEVTAVRSAARVLPPAVLLVARPLLPLGSAAAMLRKLAAGGGGSDTVHDTVAMYARRLSESVVTALAELAADPALEPHVRMALLAEPAGAETELPAGAMPSREARTSPGLRPPSSDAADFGFSAGDVAAAVAASAARVLPPAVLLVARPLLPLGSAAAMLRKLAAGGGGSDTVHDTVAMYARRLSESVVTALAELAADPALEPHVRMALLAEPAGAETELPAGAMPSREARTSPGLRPPSSDAADFGFSAGDVAAAVAAFSPRSAQQLARLRAAATEAEGGVTASAAQRRSHGAGDAGAAGCGTAGGDIPGATGAAVSPLLATARGLLEAAAEAAQERMGLRLLAGLPPPLGCRLWPPAVLRVCCNPACGDLTGECEAGLKLRRCAGCEAARYCGAECQRQHWAAGHSAECARLRRG